MKRTTLEAPSIREMTELGFDLLNLTSDEKQIESHEIEMNQAPWHKWFYAPTKIGKKRVIECWCKRD